MDPTDEMISAAEVAYGGNVEGDMIASLKTALSLAEQSAVTEYGAAYKSGDVQVWTDDDEYPVVRRIPHHQRFGGTVLTRRVIVLDDWSEVPQ